MRSDDSSIRTKSTARLIDTHSHAVFHIGTEPPLRNQPEWSVEGTLALMDQNGIEMSIISVPAAANYSEGQEASDIARRINDKIADMVVRHPTRFGGYATLPGRDTERTLREIEYALDVLKLDAVSTTTNIADTYMGDARFYPWFAELDRRHTPLFIHPVALSFSQQMDLGLNPSILEFMFDTTRMLANMVITGTKQKYPNIKMISTHGGGTIPYLIERIQTLEVHFGAGNDRPTRSADEIRRILASFYYDLTGSTSRPHLAGLLDLVPVDRLMMGFDIPYMPAWSIAPAIQAVSSHGFSEHDVARLFHGTATEVFPRLARRVGVE